MNVIERFREGRKVKTRAGEQTAGNFVRLKGENFWRRVNSDGTLTKVEDGQNGTYDFRSAGVPKKVKENTSWRIALHNSIDPTRGYPAEALEGYFLRRAAKKKQKSENITETDYSIYPNLGDSVANAAWGKYLGLEYNPKFLPIGVEDDRTNYGKNTVRLPAGLEAEIPVDTTFIKNRLVANNKFLENHPYETPQSVRIAIMADEEALAALRKTYETGDPVGMNEMSFNSRHWGTAGDMGPSPLNVFQNYNIRYDKDTNRMYYSDEYGFDNENYWPLKMFGSNLDKYLEGKPFRFRGYIDLNKK